jgi:hypothetical protein
MRKFTIILIFLIAMAIKAFAQIPNAGFENWTNGNPDGWTTYNGGSFMPITQIFQAHSGNSALRGDVLNLNDGLPALMVGGTQGFPINYRPASLTGYYKFSPAASSGDRLSVSVSLYIGGVYGTMVAGIAVGLSGTADIYTQFSIPFHYLLTDVPNSCIIQIMIIGPSIGSYLPTIGSYYILDDLAFDGTTGVEANQTDRSTEFKIYPNPSNTTLFMQGLVENTKLSIIDMQGKVVLNKNVIDNQIDISTLTDGIYTIKFENETGITTRRFIRSR